jgi:hypothetical protein
MRDPLTRPFFHIQQRRLFLKKQFLAIAMAAAVFFGTQVSADTTAVETTVQKQQDGFSISGCAGFQTTRITSYRWYGLDEPGRIYNNVVIDLIADHNINRHFSVHAGVEAFMWFNTHPLITGMIGQNQPAVGENSVYLFQAENVFTFDEDNLFRIPNDVFKGEIHLGYFPYKYNPDARNLGEYLFRSGTYPGWLKTIPFVPEARLTGLLISTTSFNKWKNDFLVTTEMDMYPFYDLSYSWISSIKVGKILDIGGGIDLARFTPANGDLTTRKKNSHGDPLTSGEVYLKNGRYVADSVIPGLIDTLGGDTAYYTFTGIKAMGRLSIDLKGLLPEGAASIFGENDGKIYGEFDILGLVNQGDYYNKLSERIPVSFGFNVPTFKLLDVLSCEFEYYTTPYPNSYANQLQAMKQVGGGTPIPDDQMIYKNNPTMANHWDLYKHDNWKWSVYIKKSIGKHFAIIGLTARDHLRTMTNSLEARDYAEVLIKNNNWYWALRAISTW